MTGPLNPLQSSQYRCRYCFAMCAAGMPHLDYSDWRDGEPPEIWQAGGAS